MHKTKTGAKSNAKDIIIEHSSSQDISINGLNRIGGVMVSELASSAVDLGFEPRSGQTKDYKIGS
jgi:hypothetical protein